MFRDLYTKHASTLPAHARDAIASLFGRDALDSRVCDLMTLSEWEDIFDEAAPTHPESCYVCGGDVPAYRADHEYVTPCDAIGHQYGTSSEDFVCYGCGEQACDPAAIAPDWAEHQKRAYRAADFFHEARAARTMTNAESRAYRAADFFREAQAARYDVAYNGLHPMRLTAPLFRDGEVTARVAVRIIGRTIPGAYIVQGIYGGPGWYAFTGEIHRL